MYLGRDTRPSSPRFAELFTKGVASIGGKVRDFGEVTTPQLHYMVRSTNVDGIADPEIEMYAKNMGHWFLETLECACGKLYI